MTWPCTPSIPYSAVTIISRYLIERPEYRRLVLCTWCVGTGTWTLVRFASSCSSHPPGSSSNGFTKASTSFTKTASAPIVSTRHAQIKRTQIDCVTSEQSQPRPSSTTMVMWSARLVLPTLLVPVFRVAQSRSLHVQLRRLSRFRPRLVYDFLGCSMQRRSGAGLSQSDAYNTLQGALYL